MPQFIYDADGKITGYKTKGGADAVFPFKHGYRVPIVNAHSALGASIHLDVKDYSTVQIGELQWYGVYAGVTAHIGETKTTIFSEYSSSVKSIKNLTYDVSQYDILSVSFGTYNMNTAQSYVKNIEVS